MDETAPTEGNVRKFISCYESTPRTDHCQYTLFFPRFLNSSLHGIFTPIVSTQIRPCHITAAGLHAAVAAGSLCEILHLRSNGQSIHEGTNTNLTAKLT